MEQAIWCEFLGKGVPTRFRDMEIGDIFYATVCANPSALKKNIKKPSNGEINEITPSLGEKSYNRLFFLVDSVPCTLRFLLLFVTIEVWGLDRTGLGWLFLLKVWSRRYGCDFLRNRNKNSENSKKTWLNHQEHIVASINKSKKTSLRPLKLT